ncbi:DUF4189 domain-containing protein [Dyella nitratireducens]|uniref:DUF4189 domain-containing protein n=1 Tax=Dyella nitratireducens TaxID=1849580 RepID=A0ABQ1FNV0_9GAMM|nr:DUF4189 domain-containing protein [Dyella nitratireducens]GGA22146.1 hypothetical protein GCM10010981_07920 [Dyella nitratireducens]GLQ44148.1 hypothetical protein GCM10007902_39980 [Dyella nitratireducens]
MNKNMIKWIIGATLLLVTTLTHAQAGPCPPGMSEYPGSNGIPSCGPLRSDYEQPKGYWADQWAAVARSNNGTDGFALDQPNEETAKQASLENCTVMGGTQCAVEVTYKNTCIAVAKGVDEAGQAHSTISTAGTPRGAMKEALKTCKKTSEKHSCQLSGIACGLPKWVSY